MSSKLTVEMRLGKGVETLTSAQRLDLIDEICAYAETDLLCYQSDESALYEKQQQLWEPIIKQVELALAIRFKRTTGIVPVEQPEASLVAIQNVVTALDDRALVVMAQLTSALGSVLLALAWMKEIITIDEAITASQLDETHQAIRWGEDADVQAKLAEKAAHIRECVDFYTKNQ